MPTWVILLAIGITIPMRWGQRKSKRWTWFRVLAADGAFVALMFVVTAAAR